MIFLQLRVLQWDGNKRANYVVNEIRSYQTVLVILS